MSILRRRALIEQGDNTPYWDNITEEWDYIIDQVGNYDNPIIVNSDNLYHNKPISISNIRDMSKLVVGYYDETSAKLIWEPLDNSSKTIVKHTTSAYPINISIDNYLNEHPTADVFMKLPEFWWRCWDINNNVDIVAFKFVTEEPTDDNNWFHWDGNIFIGVYKGYVNEADTVKLLRSISGVNPVGRYSWENIKLFARNKGANYSLITYEAHCIMALLGYGFYGTTDVKFDWVDTKNSSLNPNYVKTTGIRDGDGMTDTFENNSYVNYWGLEGWFGGQQEYIDNMKATGYGEAAILDKNSNILRRIAHAANPSYYSVGISKMVLGYYADLVPIKFQEGSYYGHGHGAEYANSPVVRGSYLSGDSTGWKSVVGSISDIDLIGGNTSETSRLQYEGNNEQNTTPTSATSVVSSYVLDQTNPDGDPNSAITFDNDNSVILAIKAASDFYALENKDWGNDTPEFIKMSKTDKLKTTRGTTLDANNYDIFMKLPEFWWKCENVDDNEDKVRFSFTMTNPNDDTWFHWEGKTFIGVYKGYINNDKLYSRSGVIPSNVSSSAAYHQYNTINDNNITGQRARNRGNNFTAMTYEIHKIMCILLWGYLGTLDYKSLLGSPRGFDFNTGYYNSSGFNDEGIQNIWGIEDWIGNKGELIEDLLFVCQRFDNTYYRSIVLQNYGESTSYKTFDIPGYNNHAPIGKFLFGIDANVIPKQIFHPLYRNEKTYLYSTSLSNNTRSAYNLVRGYYQSNVGFLGFASLCSNNYYNNTGTRLCYKGNYTIGEEFQV